MIELKEVIIQRHFASPDEYVVNGVVVVIPGKKTNDLMKLLGEKLPLQFSGLGHLKRVRRSANPEHHQNGFVEFLLCSETYLSELRSQCDQEKEESHILTFINEIAISQEIIPVSKYAPESKTEFELWNKFWPINFHPNEIERIRNKTFSLEQRQLLTTFYYTQLLDDTHRNYSHYGIQSFGAMIINPEHFLESKLICSSHNILSSLSEEDRRKILANPIASPVMLCIDEVAKISRGIRPGIENLSTGHYLCTGLDCFVYEELDVMNAMALVHSRIRHVYFIRSNESFGCFESTAFHLHCLKALNHHYRVFQYIDSSHSSASSGKGHEVIANSTSSSHNSSGGDHSEKER